MKRHGGTFGLALLTVLAIGLLSLSRYGQSITEAQAVDPYTLNYDYLSLSGDGTVFAAASNPFQRSAGDSEDTFVTLFDADTLEVLQLITMPDSVPLGIAMLSLNPDGSKFAFAPGRTSGAYIYDVPTGNITTIIPDGYIGGIDELEWNPVDERLAIGAGRVASIGHYDTYITENEDFLFLSNSQNTPRFDGLQWSPEGNRIAEGRKGGGENSSGVYALQLWSVPPETPYGTLTIPIWSLDGPGSGEISWSPSGDQLFSHLTDTEVAIFDSANGEIVQAFGLPPNETLYGSDWSPDGTQIAGYGQTAQYWIWDIASGEIVETVPAPTLISDMIWLPDGKIITAAYSQGLLVDGFSIEEYIASSLP